MRERNADCFRHPLLAAALILFDRPPEVLTLPGMLQRGDIDDFTRVRSLPVDL